MIYVDGYNLYYGCLKDTSERWLDVSKLCKHMLHDDTEIAGIRYFTALVKSRSDNPEQRHRQQTYLRALRTIPDLTIHKGVFLEKVATRLRADGRPGKPTYVNVWINEEKGSDVNLASYLLIDNFRARYDLAVVISNDGDLKLPIHWLRYECKIPGRHPEPTRKPESCAISTRTSRRIVLQADPSCCASGEPVSGHGAGRQGHHLEALRVVAAPPF